MVRLYGRWYAPLSNGLFCLAFIVLIFPGLFRLVDPPAGQEPFTPYLMLFSGLLLPLWYFGASRSPNTFLELSRTGLRRSIWGRTRSYRWEELGPIKARTRYRGSNYVWAELRNSSQARIVVDVSMGFRSGFLFGGLSIGELAAELSAWQTQQKPSNGQDAKS